MTISLLRRRLNLGILILLYGLAATSDINPALAGKKVKSVDTETTTVSAGSSVEISVTINKPAPSKGGVVYLSSSDPSIATVPDSVMVQPGNTSALFVVDTALGPNDSSMDISASYGTSTKKLSVVVKGVTPPVVSLSGLTLSPASAPGGTSIQGTVTLTAPSGPGGSVVALHNGDSSLVSIPLSVTIPTGSSQATFAITSNPVSTTSTVSLSAVYAGVKKTALLSLTANITSLASVSLNPSAVTGGGSSQGTVGLSAPAGFGGAVVTLASSNPAATVPGTVTVPAGATAASFTVSTSAVSASTLVLVSAAYGGVPLNAQLTVTAAPAGLSSLTLNPTSLIGGNSSQGTVTLTAAAPSGGAVVSLSRNNAAATVPASVTVSAGSSTATFTVSTSAVSSSTPITISGTYVGVTRTASLTVNPVAAALSSIALNPTVVIGGSQSQGTVTLTGPAPGGGAVVSLSSNNSAATVPTSVTVGAGVSTATFTVNTSAVSVSTPVTISSVYSGVTRTASVTVNPVAAGLLSIVLNPTLVVGGNPSQGTVTLSSAAPAGGAVISLSSNNSAATVPAGVTVAAGATSATFSVNTSVVSLFTSVTISATYSGVTRTASLSVNHPAPGPTLSSLTLNPTFLVGGNGSQGSVTLSAAAPTGGAVVSLSSDNSAATVPTSITVSAGATIASFTVNTTSVTSPRTATISAVYSGVTRTASLTVNPVAAALSSVALNPTSVVGGNTSQGTATLTGAAPAGGVVVSLSSNNAAATVPNSITVAAGSSTATFTVNTTSVTSPRSVTISGVYNGVTRTASLTVDSVPVAVALSSLSLNPISIVGGTSSQGTVTLTGGAPVGGAVVALSSTFPLIANAPPSITVPQGLTSATFTVNSALVTSQLLVTISASYGSVTRGVGLTVATSLAPIFYAAPNGSPSGNGSIFQPWDLQTALSQPPGVVPGATIYLRGGKYTGKFIGKLVGTPANPITVQSNPGEWATIDGFTTVQLSAPISSSATTLTLSDGSKFPAGVEILIDDENLMLAAKNGNQYSNVQRGWNGTASVTHAAGTVVSLGGDNLTLFGSDAIYRDFEVMNSDPYRITTIVETERSPRLRGDGVEFAGPRIKAVNLVVHDTTNGIYKRESSIDSEVYGCIVYNNGYVTGGLAAGHAMYIQNNTGTFRIVDDIVFNNFNHGIKSLSQSGDAVNVYHEGIVSFNTGSPWARGTVTRKWNLVAGGSSGIADNITVTRSFFYHQRGIQGDNVHLGYSGTNGSVTVTNNYLAGGTQGLNLDKWTPAVVTGNTIHTSNNPTPGGWSTFLNLYTPLGGASVTWNNNSYFNEYFNVSQQNDNAFLTAGSSQMSFSSWKITTGFDGASQYTFGKPLTAKIFVRQNQYDSRRAHIIVYNWPLSAFVDVDVSGVLPLGSTYDVRNVQDYFAAPVLSGIYLGGTIRLPMTGLSVARPIGYDFTPAHTGPEFNTFVLVRR